MIPLYDRAMLSPDEQEAADRIAATLWDLNVSSLRARRILGCALILAYGLKHERSA
jgi:hypothetical protein